MARAAWTAGKRCNQDADNGNHDEKLDQRECPDLRALARQMEPWRFAAAWLADGQSDASMDGCPILVEIGRREGRWTIPLPFARQAGCKHRGSPREALISIAVRELAYNQGPPRMPETPCLLLLKPAIGKTSMRSFVPLTVFCLCLTLVTTAFPKQCRPVVSRLGPVRCRARS